MPLTLHVLVTADAKGLTEATREAKAEVAQLGQAATQAGRAGEAAGKSIDAAAQATARAKAEAKAVRQALVDQAGAARQASAANAAVAASSRLTGAQLGQLQFQLNDIATGLLSGQSPFMILAQQGPQVTQIFGGVRATLAAIPPVVRATAIAVAVLVAPLALVSSKTIELANQARGFSVALKGMGRDAEVSASRLVGMVADLRTLGAGAEEAREAVTGLFRNIRLDPATAERIARLGPDIAAGLGKGLAEATEEVGKALSGGLGAVRKLDDALNVLTESERRLVAELYFSARAAEANDMVLAALERRFQGLARESLSPAGKALAELKTGWQSFMAALSESRPTIAVIKFLSDQLGALARAGRLANDEGFQASVAIVAKNRELAEAEATLRNLRAQFNRRESADLLNTIRQQEAKVARLRADIDSMIGRQRKVAENLTRPSTGTGSKPEDPNNKFIDDQRLAYERLLPLLGVAAEARARELAEVNAVAEAVERGLLPWQEEELIRIRVAQATFQQRLAAKDLVDAATLEADAALRIADAWTISAEAGRQAEIAERARAEAARNAAVDQAALQAAIERRVAAESLTDLRRQVADAELAAAGLERLAAAHGEGAAAVAEVNRQNAIAVLREAALAKASAETRDQVLDAVKALDELSQRQLRLNDQGALNARLLAQKETLRLLEAEVGLLGATDEQRAIELAKLQAINDLKAYGNGLSEEQRRLYLANAEAIAQAQAQLERARREQELWLEPLKNAVRGIQSAFADAFQKIFEGGVKSFGDLADTVKGVFTRLAAEIATLLVFRPVVGGILGSLGLGGLASQLGLGGAAIGGAAAGGAAGGVLGGTAGTVGQGVLGIGGMISQGLGVVSSTFNNFALTLAEMLGTWQSAIGAPTATSLGVATALGGQLTAMLPFIGGLAGGLAFAFQRLRAGNGPTFGASFQPGADGRLAIRGVGTDNGFDQAEAQKAAEGVQGLTNAFLDQLGAKVTGNAFRGEVGYFRGRFAASTLAPHLDPELHPSNTDPTGIFGLTTDIRSFRGEGAQFKAIADWIARNTIVALNEGTIEGLSEGAKSTLKVGLGNIARGLIDDIATEADFTRFQEDLGFLAVFDELREKYLVMTDAAASAAEAQEAYNRQLAAQRAELATAAAEWAAGEGNPLRGIDQVIDRSERLFDPLGPLRSQIRLFLGSGGVVDPNREVSLDDETTRFRFGPEDGRSGDPIVHGYSIGNVPHDREGITPFDVLGQTRQGDRILDGLQIANLRLQALTSGEEGGDRRYGIYREDGSLASEVTFDSAATLETQTHELVTALEGAGIAFEQFLDSFFTPDQRDRLQESFDIARGMVDDALAQLALDPDALVESRPLEGLALVFETQKAKIEALRPQLEALNEDLARFGQTAIDVDGKLAGATEELRANLQDQLVAELEAIVDPTQGQLTALEDWRDGMLDQIRVLYDMAGATEDQLLATEAGAALLAAYNHQLEQINDTASGLAQITAEVVQGVNAQIQTQEQLAGSYRSVAESARRALLGSAISGTGTLVPVDRLAKVRGEFERLLAVARGGDGEAALKAASDAVALSDDLRQLARQVHGAGSGFVEITGQIDTGLADIASIAEGQADVAEQQLETLRQIRDRLAPPATGTVQADLIVQAVNAARVASSAGILGEAQGQTRLTRGQYRAIAETLAGQTFQWGSGDHARFLAADATREALLRVAIQAAGGTFHEGGIIGRRRMPLPGMRPDEELIVAQAGEEVLTRDDPRHVLNAVAGRPFAAVEGRLEGSADMLRAIGVLVRTIREEGDATRRQIRDGDAGTHDGLAEVADAQRRGQQMAEHAAADPGRRAA